MDPVAIGSRIKALRERAGLTRGELIRSAGLSDPRALWRLESGAVTPSVRKLESVARALGATVNDLLLPRVPAAKRSPRKPIKAAG